MTVAVVRAAAVTSDLQHCLAKTRDLAADAGRREAKIVLFPEAFLSGYPKGATFGAAVGARSDAAQPCGELSRLHFLHDRTATRTEY